MTRTNLIDDPAELNHFLDDEFNKIRGKGYHYMDTPWNDCLPGFPLRRKEFWNWISEKDKISILDEGCGGGYGLYSLVREIEDNYPDKKIEALGITAALNHVWPVMDVHRGAQDHDFEYLGGKRFQTPQGTVVSFREHNIYAVSELGQGFDLIFSRHSYMHLCLPLLAHLLNLAIA